MPGRVLVSLSMLGTPRGTGEHSPASGVPGRRAPVQGSCSGRRPGTYRFVYFSLLSRVCSAVGEPMVP